MRARAAVTLPSMIAVGTEHLERWIGWPTVSLQPLVKSGVTVFLLAPIDVI
jgi:hypothetical protein